MGMPKTTHKGSVYLSGPIAGQTYDDARFGWRATFAAAMEEGIKVLSPMRHEGHLAEVQGTLKAAEQLDHFFSGARIIVEKDALDIKRCDIVVVNLLGAMKVSIGTVAEIGMAQASGKTIILIMEDPNTIESDEFVKDTWNLDYNHPDYGRKIPVLKSNVHEHPFVTVPAALRLNNLDEAIYAVNALLSEGI
jgi:nucleoside 2-deoxyribosyltransferase